MLSALLVAVISLMAGAMLGTVLGFSAASHRDVLRGVRPMTKNRFIVFLARPTAELSLLEGAVMLVLVVVWLAVFFALCLVPAVAAQRLSGEGPPLILPAYVCMAVTGWLGQKFGAHAWRTMS